MAREKSEYNEITVYETGELFGETGRFRCMKFADEAVQGAIDLRNPARVVLAYQRAVIELMERCAPAFGSAFVIGHGTGTIARTFADGRRIVVAEIDAAVVELSRRYFGYGPDNVKIGDGRTLLSMEDDDSFDLVVADAFTSQGTPRALTTLSFFRMTAEKLAPGGSLLMNAFGKPLGDKRIAAVFATLGEAFGHTAAYWLPEGTSGEGNIVLVGSKREIPLREQPAAGFKAVPIEPGHVIRDKKGDGARFAAKHD